MTYQSVDEALQQKRRPVRVKFEVRDIDGEWIDLTDRFGVDRLVSVGGGLAARAERETGAFDVQLSSLTVWNGDRYWDRPPDDNFATYTWKRLRARVSLITLGGERALGVWVIERVTTKANGPNATITLRTLSSFLVDAQADRVRKGKQWWINQPAGRLVRRLLETRHTVAEVAAFPDIQDSYQIPLSDATIGSSGPAVSSFARPPETDRDYTVYGSPIAANNDEADPDYGNVWIGLEEELWRFRPVTGVWTYWTRLPAALVSLGVKIHHVYVSTLRNKVVVLAWAPEFPSANAPARLAGTEDLVTHDNVVTLVADLTTAPATMTEYGPTSSEFFTGLFSIRAGKQEPAAAFNPSDVAIGCSINFPSPPDSKKSGINMPMPTSHWIRCQDETPAVVSPSPSTPVPDADRALFNMNSWNGDVAGPEDVNMKSRIESLAFWQQEIGGYLSWSDDVSGGTYPADYRHSIGQYAGAFAFNEATDELVGTWVDWDAASGRYRAKFVVRDIQTGGLTDTGYYVMTGGRYYLPTSMQFNPAGTKLLVTAHVFSESRWVSTAPVDTGDDEPVGGIVVEYDWPLAAGAFTGQAAQTLHFLSTNFSAGDAQNRKRWIPLQACYGSKVTGTRYVGMTMLDYSKIGGACWGAGLLQLGSTNVGNVRWSTGRQSGMVRWIYGVTSGILVWQDAGANAIVKMDDSAYPSQPVLVDDGIAPVEGDSGLAAGLVYCAVMTDADLDPDERVGGILGISGPGTGAEQDPDVMNPPSPGKFYLYQVAYALTDRIELADFSGMTVWDALSSLAAIADFIFGYDDDAQFFFKLRPKPTATLATIKATPNVLAGEIAATDIAKDWGYDEIYNYAEVVPSRVVLAEPTGTVEILERPEGWRRPPWNGSVTVVQKSLLRQKIVLKVVEGGTLANEDDGSVHQDRQGNVIVHGAPGAGERRSKLRLAWLSTDFVIETQLLEPWEADTTHRDIVVPYVAAIDTTRGSDPFSGVAITNGELYGDTVEISGSVFNVKDLVHDPVAGTTTITLTGFDVDGDTPLPIGTRVVIRSWENNSWSDSALGIARTADPSTTVTPGAEGAETTYEAISTRNMVAGMIARPHVDVTAAGDPDLLVTEVVDGTTWTGRRVGIGGDADDIPQFRPIRGYLAPIQNAAEFPPGTIFWVGDSGIGLIFEPPDPNAGGVIESPFMVGDEIHVDAQGLTLDAQELTKQVAMDRPSIEKFGVLPFRPARRSPFLNYQRARELARRTVSLNAAARYVLDVDLPLTFVPKLGDCYLVEDARILPWSSAANPQGDATPVAPDTARGVAFAVRAFTVDPIQGKSKVTLRAVNPHGF